jgi:hypothetical protein
LVEHEEDRQGSRGVDDDLLAHVQVVVVGVETDSDRVERALVDGLPVLLVLDLDGSDGDALVVAVPVHDGVQDLGFRSVAIEELFETQQAGHEFDCEVFGNGGVPHEFGEVRERLPLLGVCAEPAVLGGDALHEQPLDQP